MACEWRGSPTPPQCALGNAFARVVLVLHNLALAGVVLRMEWNPIHLFTRTDTDCTCACACQAFTIYAWNEFGEGGILAPTTGEGFMKLQTISAVFNRTR